MWPTTGQVAVCGYSNKLSVPLNATTSFFFRTTLLHADSYWK